MNIRYSLINKNPKKAKPIEDKIIKQEIIIEVNHLSYTYLFSKPSKTE